VLPLEFLVVHTQPVLSLLHASTDLLQQTPLVIDLSVERFVLRNQGLVLLPLIVVQLLQFHVGHLVELVEMLLDLLDLVLLVLTLNEDVIQLRPLTIVLHLNRSIGMITLICS
jgi:hypothetical protein